MCIKTCTFIHNIGEIIAPSRVGSRCKNKCKIMWQTIKTNFDSLLKDESKKVIRALVII